MFVVGSLACTLVTACAREVPRYSPGIVVGDQGHSAELVFDSPAMVEALPQGTKVATWRDDSLNIRPLPTEIARASWPRHHRPSLDNVRRVNLRQQSDSILYFREEGFEYRSNRSRR